MKPPENPGSWEASHAPDFTNYFIFIISSALPLIVYFHQHEQNKGKDISSFKGENFRYSLYKDVN